MNYQEIIDKTYELVDTIKSSEIYKKYLEYETKVLDDKDVNILLTNFHKYKNEFEEAYKYRDYYPEFSLVKNRFQDAKIKLMSNELFKGYKTAEREIDSYIYEIEYRLKEVVNIKEKHGKIKLR